MLASKPLVTIRSEGLSVGWCEPMA